jgi:hypothetical protein
MPDDQPRIRAERKHSGMLPVFHALERIPLDLTLTPLEYEEIRYGIVPQAIEDEWFIFMEHNCLYFYRAYQGAFFAQYALRGEMIAIGRLKHGYSPVSSKCPKHRKPDQLLCWLCCINTCSTMMNSAVTGMSSFIN